MTRSVTRERRDVVDAVAPTSPRDRNAVAERHKRPQARASLMPGRGVRFHRGG